MAIHGIGTDSVEIARIEQALSRHGERFATRLLHPDELLAWQFVVATTGSGGGSCHVIASLSGRRTCRRYQQ